MIPDTKHSGNLWGSEVCSLSMPGYTVEFRDLCLSQQSFLMDEFNDFKLDVSSVDVKALHKLECDVYRLETAPDIDPGELEECGLYTPIQIRNGNQLKLIGHDFIAEFTINSDIGGISSSSLGVFARDDLNESSVVDNFLRYFTAHYAVARSGAILHSAGIVVDESAIVFSGYSNVGKTTLSRKAYAAGCPILSDDINLILPSDKGYLAHKVPFTGEFGKTVEQTCMGRSYPLNMIALLEQGNPLNAELVKPSSAVSRLLTASPFVNSDDSHIPSLFDVFSDLTASVQIIKLTLTRECKFNDIISMVRQLEC